MVSGRGGDARRSGAPRRRASTRGDRGRGRGQRGAGAPAAHLEHEERAGLAREGRRTTRSSPAAVTGGERRRRDSSDWRRPGERESSRRIVTSMQSFGTSRRSSGWPSAAARRGGRRLGFPSGARFPEQARGRRERDGGEEDGEMGTAPRGSYPRRRASKQGGRVEDVVRPAVAFVHGQKEEEEEKNKRKHIFAENPLGFEENS